MKTGLRRWLVGSLGASLMVAAGLASASDKSVTIFPAEGNKTCSDYSSNKVILTMGINSPSTNASGVIVSGPDRPSDTDTLPEYLVYKLAADSKSLEFGPTGPTPPATNTPIDYVLLKSGSTVSVVIYSSGGVISDAHLSIPGATPGSAPLPITGFSFCYGLGNSATSPPPVVKATTPSCSSLVNGLDAQAIMCSQTTHPVLLCSMELDQPFFGMKSGDTCCVCNHEALVECDPNLAEGAEGACPGPTYGEPKEVTTSIEINKDPYYCTVVGGVKKCYTY
jgi:hypothetical protein